jgi:deoxyribodipyrimidine photo-lyase
VVEIGQRAILWHHPGVLRQAFDPAFRRIAWETDRRALRAWQEGCTGYPVVDAAMRQLTATGWMPNPARMIVASFLTRDLLIDWRIGEAWLMRHLIDGDPAANNGDWQWTAETGTDAVPYFRVFNPMLQGKRYDPDGTYVRRWIPALARVPTALVREPGNSYRPRSRPRHHDRRRLPFADRQAWPHGRARYRRIGRRDDGLRPLVPRLRNW